MTAATVEKYVAAYFPGLKTSLDAIDSALYTDLAANAAVTITYFDTSFLTTAQLNQGQALLICIDGAGIPSVAGWSMERHFSKRKIYDQNWEKTEGLDLFIGEFCRVLHITLKEFNAKTSTQRASIYSKSKTNSIYLSPALDGRAQVYKDFEVTDVRKDREAHPLDNRYL